MSLLGSPSGRHILTLLIVFLVVSLCSRGTSPHIAGRVNIIVLLSVPVAVSIRCIGRHLGERSMTFWGPYLNSPRQALLQTSLLARFSSLSVRTSLSPNSILSVPAALYVRLAANRGHSRLSLPVSRKV